MGVIALGHTVGLVGRAGLYANFEMELEITAGVDISFAVGGGFAGADVGR